MCRVSPGCDCQSFPSFPHAKHTPLSSAHTKGPSLHIWRICICSTFRYPFIKAWISVRASVNIHFLKSFFFLHSFGSIPWLRTTAPSLRFLPLSLPFFCFQAQIQLDCGEDNICVPDLKLAVYGWEEVTFLWLYLMVLDVWIHIVVSDCVVVLLFSDFMLSDRSAPSILMTHNMFGPLWCLMPVTFR